MRYNLSEINDIIRDRRTIRPEQFSDRKVHREIVEVLLNNAIWAPNHGLTQPWRFKVFMNGAQMKLGEFLAELYKSKTPEEKFLPSKYEKFSTRMEKSSVVIAICMKAQELPRFPESEEISAVSMAVQNMHLTCTAYGIGAYWGSGSGTYAPETKKFLGLEEGDKCLGFFYLGYPAVDWPKSRRRPIEYVTEWIDEA